MHVYPTHWVALHTVEGLEILTFVGNLYVFVSGGFRGVGVSYMGSYQNGPDSLHWTVCLALGSVTLS